MIDIIERLRRPIVRVNAEVALLCEAAIRAADEIERLTAERDEARAELERERIRLVACGVVAMSNTPESAARTREMHADYRSESCDAVASAVDREMALRAERDAMRAALNTIARTPAMPFPDPGAHSERAYHEAVFVAWSRSNQMARAALAQIEQEKANGSR